MLGNFFKVKKILSHGYWITLDAQLFSKYLFLNDMPVLQIKEYDGFNQMFNENLLRLGIVPDTKT